ncbi:MAG: hypothetical protein V7700_03815 [Halioglobus sp.]
MVLRCSNNSKWLFSLLLGALLTASALAVTDAEVKQLQQQCEVVRKEALAPMRAQKTQTCIDQQLRSKERCEHYYTTYGNVAPGPSGAPQQGYFYNLPECQSWLEARDALKASRSRP